VLRVKAHPHLARRDQSVIYELRVNMVQAALGDRIEIPTLDGPVEIAIPSGTQHGQSFRLAGRGMPMYAAAGVATSTCWCRSSSPRT